VEAIETKQTQKKSLAKRFVLLFEEYYFAILRQQ
jgi:hypothetical protein